MIIKAAKRIFNPDKICRSYCDFYFGVTFLEHTVDRADRSRNATWARAKENNKKKEKKRRDVTSHIFAQTTHIALPPPKLWGGVESRT